MLYVCSQPVAYTALGISLFLVLLLLLVVFVGVFAWFVAPHDRNREDDSGIDDGGDSDDTATDSYDGANVGSWWIGGERNRRHLRRDTAAAVYADVKGSVDYDRWDLFVHHAASPTDNIDSTLRAAYSVQRGRRPDLIALSNLPAPTEDDGRSVGVEPSERWRYTYWNYMTLQRQVAYMQGYWENRDNRVYNALEMSFAKPTAEGLRYDDASGEIRCSMYVRECRRISDQTPFLYVQFDQEIVDGQLQEAALRQVIAMMTKLAAMYSFASWPMIICGGFGVHGVDRVLDALLNNHELRGANDLRRYHVPEFYRWFTFNGTSSISSFDVFAISERLYERVEFFVEFATQWDTSSCRIGARGFVNVAESMRGTYDVTSDKFREYVAAVRDNATELKRDNVHIGEIPKFDTSHVDNVTLKLTKLDSKFIVG